MCLARNLSCCVCIQRGTFIASQSQENTVLVCVGYVAHMFTLSLLLMLSQVMGIEFLLLVDCRVL